MYFQKLNMTITKGVRKFGKRWKNYKAIDNLREDVPFKFSNAPFNRNCDYLPEKRESFLTKESGQKIVGDCDCVGIQDATITRRSILRNLQDGSLTGNKAKLCNATPTKKAPCANLI